MYIEHLRLVAFCAYLAAWVVFAIGAVMSAIPQIQRRAASPLRLKARVAIGTLLQIASNVAITFCRSDGPLRPKSLELVGVFALAPLATTNRCDGGTGNSCGCQS
jgi:hypothetical protein